MRTFPVTHGLFGVCGYVSGRRTSLSDKGRFGIIGEVATYRAAEKALLESGNITPEEDRLPTTKLEACWDRSNLIMS